MNIKSRFLEKSTENRVGVIKNSENILQNKLGEIFGRRFRATFLRLQEVATSQDQALTNIQLIFNLATSHSK